jgi:hypothetical protein
MAYVINADDIKIALPGYNPDRSDLLHRESTKLADASYAKAVKERPEPLVILMAGGTASGKSEYVSAYLQDIEAIVFDGTMPSFTGAEIKIKKAMKAKKQVTIHCVLPESFFVAFTAFLNRDRKFPNEHFYRTHSATRKAVLDAAKQFPDIAILIVISSVQNTGDNPVMKFRELNFPDRGALIEFLQSEQYTEDSIKQQVTQ